MMEPAEVLRSSVPLVSCIELDVYSSWVLGKRTAAYLHVSGRNDTDMALGKPCASNAIQRTLRPHRVSLFAVMLLSPAGPGAVGAHCQDDE
jgi:hypothetical protein